MKKKLRNKVVLVTGATGFIGSHLVPTLQKEGASVHALVRPCRRGSLAFDEGVHVVEGDLTDAETMASVVASVRPNLVFHLAGYTDVSRDADQTEPAFAVNLHGTVNLIKALSPFPPECTLITGSAEEYGDQSVPFHEDMALDPRSPYSASKAAALMWAQMWHRTTGFPVVMVRPFLTYGPGQSPQRLIPQAVLAALEEREFPMTRGEQTREFTYIDDVVEGVLSAVFAPEALGEIINLGCGREIKIIDVVNQIFELAGGCSRPQPGAIAYREAEIWRYVAATEKAERLLGWKARTPLADGLKTTINWYREQMRSGSAETNAAYLQICQSA